MREKETKIGEEENRESYKKRRKAKEKYRGKIENRNDSKEINKEKDR